MTAKERHRPLISVVTPCFNEEENVQDCHDAVRRLFDGGELAAFDFEHVFCDNGSSDRTVAILKSIAERDRRVKIIVNSRNFGPFCSNFNGILSTRGDAVLTFLPADLQDPPELLPELVRHWRQGFEVVYGIRRNREEGVVLRAVRKVYYRLLTRFASINIPVDVGEFQLVDRSVVEALRKFDDYYPYIRGMIANCGFRSTGVAYTWKARARGRSKNRLFHLVDQGLNGLISFTKVPIRLCLFFGFAMSVASFAYAFVSLALNLAYYRKFVPPGIPTLIVAVFFFAGLQLFFFGVLGEYIAAIHFQVRKRPLVIERERVNFDEEEDGNPTAPGPAMNRPHPVRRGQSAARLASADEG